MRIGNVHSLYSTIFGGGLATTWTGFSRMLGRTLGTTIDSQTTISLTMVGTGIVVIVPFIFWFANDRNKTRQRILREQRRGRAAFELARIACEKSLEVDHTSGKVRALIVGEEAESAIIDKADADLDEENGNGPKDEL